MNKALISSFSPVKSFIKQRAVVFPLHTSCVFGCSIAEFQTHIRRQQNKLSILFFIIIRDTQSYAKADQWLYYIESSH